MKIILEEFGGSIVYVITGGGLISIFCYVLTKIIGS